MGDKLLELYKKVIHGLATDDEYHEYIFELSRCCFEENYVLEVLHNLTKA